VARKLRIQFPGAIYHVINRGNYRRDLFLSVGEAKAFLETVREARDVMGWRVHAYVLMRNHYHLAIETPEPNLVDGMHWLQSSWATRFNRFRQERGHLFQGRYQALLIEDAAALARVVDYIHLNPVRAKIVPAEQVGNFRWSSLPGILRGDGWVDNGGWRGRGRYGEEDSARKDYERLLIALGRDEARWDSLGLKSLSVGWAIGTAAWRHAMAKEFQQRALEPGLELAEVREIRERSWEDAVQAALLSAARTDADLVTLPLKQPWKLAIATQVRCQGGAPWAWLAQRLHLGRAVALWSYFCRQKRLTLQQTTA
jgi:REP element-mobilizing transposase RayT